VTLLCNGPCKVCQNVGWALSFTDTNDFKEGNRTPCRNGNEFDERHPVVFSQLNKLK